MTRTPASGPQQRTARPRAQGREWGNWQRPGVPAPGLGPKSVQWGCGERGRHSLALLWEMPCKATQTAQPPGLALSSAQCLPGCPGPAAWASRGPRAPGPPAGVTRPLLLETTGLWVQHGLRGRMLEPGGGSVSAPEPGLLPISACSDLNPRCLLQK